MAFGIILQNLAYHIYKKNKKKTTTAECLCNCTFSERYNDVETDLSASVSLN